MELKLHHIEMCVSDPHAKAEILQQRYGFDIVGHRETTLCKQFVLQQNRTVFVVSGRKCSSFESADATSKTETDPLEPWTVFCCGEKGPHRTDSVFNIALQVKNLDDYIGRIEDQSLLLQPISKISEEIRYAVFKSNCGNVVHTLIEKASTYQTWFLPGFTRLDSVCNSQKIHCRPKFSYIDHVALACLEGETESIIEWYEKVFGMTRFLCNRQDSEEKGFVIDGDVSLRMKVLQFWKCSERGLTSISDLEFGNKKDCDEFKIVVVESLPGIPNTQIENFLQDHNGPGLQHVGLHTSNIVLSARQLSLNGVPLRQPPPTYYTDIGQLNVIKKSGEDVDLLKSFGILLDMEADSLDVSDRYLLQGFTHPIFDRDTFFLELIQRRGATGFGVGNVTALAHSIKAYQQQEC